MIRIGGRELGVVHHQVLRHGAAHAMVARQGDVHLDASLGYLDDRVRANASDLCLRHNTQLVADALVKAGKDFDLQILQTLVTASGRTAST